MPLDEDNRAILAQLEALGATSVHQMTVDEARSSFTPTRRATDGKPSMASVRDVDLEVADGETIVVRVYRPTGTVGSLTVYFHGGGWVLGHIDDSDVLARDIASRAGSVVVLVGYRKAPEHPYPAPVEDAWTGLRWAARHVIDLAGAEVPVVVAGSSAGGNLAAVCAVRARDAGWPQLALQVLVYPITDHDPTRASHVDPENQVMLLDGPSMRWYWELYAPASRRLEPDASPLRTPSLVGVAPALIVIATHDPVRDEGVAYAERLREAGVDVQLDEHAGQMHGFFSMIGVLPAADRARTAVLDRIRSAGKHRPTTTHGGRS